MQASADALFTSGQHAAAAEAYSSLLEDTLDFHPGLRAHKNYASLLANRAACHLALRQARAAAPAAQRAPAPPRRRRPHPAAAAS